jgi:hypothetical protein
VTKCRGRCHSKGNESKQGDVRYCEHRRIWICTRGANPYTYAFWDRLYWYLAPILWLKARKALK